MTSGGWWDSMADLKLCGKKVTNEQAKQIFTGMMGLIVLLVVVVISMSAGGGDGGADAGGGNDAAVPNGASPSYSSGGGSTAGRTAPVGTSQSGMIRITGPNNRQCLPSGCTGRLEVKAGAVLADGTRDPNPTWGTVCGHWLWNNDEPANIACRDLGYESGSLFTYGASFTLSEMPAHLGFQTCTGLEASLTDCELHAGDDGNFPSAECYSDPDARTGCNSGCSNHIDQGVVCYAAGTVTTQMQAWALSEAGTSTCRGCGVGCDMVGEARDDDAQSIFFGCIEFYSTNCAYDATQNSRGSFTRALAEFSACVETNEAVPGYCHGSITTAAMLANHDVCEGGATENIAFHIRIPVLVETEQTIHLRYHADFGAGSFIGMDGAEHTPGNLWGHVQISDQHLTLGDHEFEALGFEDCCDGHSELEIHLPCDADSDYWRVVQTGGHDCMSCKTVDRNSATCTAGTSAAAVCGTTGAGMTCGANEAPPPERVATSDIYRLSDYPQGRIEVYNSAIGGWGTVCGHWLWDNHNVAKIVCQKLGYEDGSLYTFGVSSTTMDLPIVTGYRRCELADPTQPESATNSLPANIFDCGQHGNPGFCTSADGRPVGLGGDVDDQESTINDQGSCESAGNTWTVDYDFAHPDGRCNHAIDQGAICLNSDAGTLNCHTHNGAVETGATCDDWHHCDANGCQNCGGNSYARAMDGRQDSTQDLVFGCVQFASVYCDYDASSAATASSYADALNAFTTCAAAPTRAGYCRGSLVSAAFLSNQDVCDSGATSDIGFHIRIPFQVNLAGTYVWRIHADFGRGSFIGVDGPTHTAGNQWGHLSYTAVLTAGDHEYETLGFEDCCDGHSEVEIQLIHDQSTQDGVWRVVVAGETLCLEGDIPLADHPECMIDTDSAAQCGAIGDVASCHGSQDVRLSSTPQGRIEVFNPLAMGGAGAWGTMCGHYFWDNDNPAIIACRALGYDTGSLYTYGADASLPSLPIVTGFRQCHPADHTVPEDPVTNPLPATVFDCEPHDGNMWHDGMPTSPTDFDCVECTSTGDVNANGNPNSIDSPPASDRGSDCTHAIDQGAMCYNAGAHGQTKCHDHTAAGMDTTTCDDWHGCDGGCIKCSGCSFGCASTDANHDQDIMFGCVQFASTHCVHDATGMADPSYAAALRIFTECAMVDPQPAGYCMGSLASAAYLSNQDVCLGANADGSGASNSDIGFHVRIPFRCNTAGLFNFRYHADFGSGSFIGVDGPEHTPGNLWGHLQLTSKALTVGEHEFEALGFEDCCDGHSELEVHLPSDTATTPWRVVVSGVTQCLQETGMTGGVLDAVCGPPADVGASAAQCGEAGGVVTCTGSQTARLSAYPQGRIEVFNPAVGWGTVCGHWMWDNDNVANMVCQELGYDGGALYTYGAAPAGSGLQDLPVVAGFRVCELADPSLPESATNAWPASIWDCREAGGPADRDCQTAGSACVSLDPSCTHSIDQGAICFHAADGGALNCHTTHTDGQTGVGYGGDFVCDDWHSCTDGGCQTCRGAQVGRADEAHVQDVTFGCVSFATTMCTHDITNGDGSYARALREFAMCAGVNPQPAGYCRGSLVSAALLSNHDVCAGGATTDIGFHIRIPFRVNLGGGEFHFRMHADYGMGTFVGVDGAEHTPGNTWGHLLMSAVQLTEGEHEFESLGFEDCCDGHAELEIHLPCDWHTDPWRIVVSGESDCMRCTAADPAFAGTQTCSSEQGSAGCCGAGGGATDCTAGANTCGDPYIGCFIDYAERDMKGEQIVLHDASATIQTCSSYCYSRGYTFYAMQYSRECWCDNNYDYNGYSAQGIGEAETACPSGSTCNVDGVADADGDGAADADGGCNMACEGDPTVMCGGSWRNSVYETRGTGPTLLDGLQAKYTFDDPMNIGADTSGNGRNGVVMGSVRAVEGGGYERGTGSGYGGMAASFDGNSGYIVSSAFENYDWGTEFSLSFWFNRGCTTMACGSGPGLTDDPADDVPRNPVCDGNYAGLVSNGYYTSSSFEVRMGREAGCTKLGGGVVTVVSGVPWDHDNMVASLGEWHHVTMIYDTTNLHFYLDNVISTSTADTGRMVLNAHGLVLGKAGAGDGARDEFFLGMMDDVQIWNRALSTDEVQSLFNHQ